MCMSFDDAISTTPMTRKQLAEVYEVLGESHLRPAQSVLPLLPRICDPWHAQAWFSRGILSLRRVSLPNLRTGLSALARLSLRGFTKQCEAIAEDPCSQVQQPSKLLAPKTSQPRHPSQYCVGAGAGNWGPRVRRGARLVYAARPMTTSLGLPSVVLPRAMTRK